ncbi:MAG TPA: DNA mismatch repair protein MutS [Bacillota bacterium]|nr:DNA mismatch repair protein MutS [Bacillota bacterium]
MTDEPYLTYASIVEESISPMMRQYLEQKKSVSDAILMFRLGDFYEMFFDDAILASRVLELALTARDCGSNQRAPMCGVPHHAAANYMQKLVTLGYKVAISDQMEDPSLAKGLVKRSVTRVLTPGTLTDTTGLDEKKNNFLVCVYKLGMQYGVAAADISTGNLEATQLITGNTAQHLINLLSKYRASEMIFNEAFQKDEIFSYVSTQLVTAITLRPIADFSCGRALRVLPSSKEVSKGKTVSKKRRENDYQNDAKNVLLEAALDAILAYLDETQKAEVSHFGTARIFEINDTMELDNSTRTNLELTSTIRSKSKKGSFLWAIDLTETAMGGRLLAGYVAEPLIDPQSINERLDSVEQAANSFIHRSELREALSGVYDLERLASRISLLNVNARDLLALRNTLRKLPFIAECAKHFDQGLLGKANASFDTLDDILCLLEASIPEEPSIGLHDGGIIKAGFNQEADDLRDASTNAKAIILNLETQEREKTGIKNLKIGYNRVFGYYIEVSKGNVDLVPDYYIRKQTLTNGERYITEEMKSIEDRIIGAQSKLVALEFELFTQIRDKIAEHVHRIFKVSEAIALFDVMMSLGELAERNHYCRPCVDHSNELTIVEGRHPVVEKMLSDGSFVPNGITMNDDNHRIMVLTGPNMAGKSTYMRQVALIVLLAQIGSFVPATSAHIGVVDRIFTRIGASDDISLGQSTFMVEMNEVSTILRNATYRSLLLLDEVGRGTSTYDGLSIAWAILEFIANRSVLFARTIFATHYHELNQLERDLPGVYNAHVEVKEENEEVSFLHKISLGGTSDSYGIEVARLAGVPQDVVSRAKLILNELERTKRMSITYQGQNDADNEQADDYGRPTKPMEGQIPLFQINASSASASPIITELREMDISKMTPLEAMNILYVLIEKAKGE